MKYLSILPIYNTQDTTYKTWFPAIPLIHPTGSSDGSYNNLIILYLASCDQKGSPPPQKKERRKQLLQLGVLMTFYERDSAPSHDDRLSTERQEIL